MMDISKIEDFVEKQQKKSYPKLWKSQREERSFFLPTSILEHYQSSKVFHKVKSFVERVRQSCAT